MQEMHFLSQIYSELNQYTAEIFFLSISFLLINILTFMPAQERGVTF